MEHDAHSRRGRLMGKLFGRERKTSGSNEVVASNEDLNSFLHGPSDALPVSHAAPQMLAKLDTSNARRYPNALDVSTPLNTQQPNHHALPVRTRPPRNKKGLVVRFVDTFPEVIGEGGDECSVSTVEISKRKRAQSAPPPPPPPAQVRKLAQMQERDRSYSDSQQNEFIPPPIRRTQTGFSQVAEAAPPPQPPIPPPVYDLPYVPAGNPMVSKLDSPVVSTDENRKSFIEINQAKQRQAEGMAFAKAVRSASSGTQSEWEEMKHKAFNPSTPTESYPAPIPPTNTESPDSQQRRPPSDQSPSTPYTQSSSPALTQRWPSVRDQKLGDSPTKRNIPMADTSTPPGDDSLDMFVARTRHLFELFRLSSETVKPILSSLPDDLARAALWWFLKGRMALEISIREQPQNPQHVTQIQASRQQAYADLAKAYWLFEEILPHLRGPVDIEVQDVRQTIMSQLRKLASSMKRNGFLPPEEPFFPQTIDKSVWLEYPAINQDIIALLWGSWSSSIAAPQGHLTGLPLLAAFPLGDTPELFCFGRYVVDVYLMEQGMESQKFYFPSLLSVTRYPTQPNIDFCIASQNGAVQLRIQSNKKSGPSWNDVKWRAENCTLEIKLPRGFIMLVKCKPQDFKMLWSMQDFSAKALATLVPRKEEDCVFKTTLRSFQYFDSNPQSTTFPRESIRSCDIALFEKIFKETSPTGPRAYHRGFRLAVVTGPTTKLLSAVNHMYLPQVPVQFGFLRGEHGEPALLLRFDEGKSNGRMVISFNDEPERLRFHSLLIGTTVQQDEKIFSEVPIVGYSISQNSKSGPMASFAQLPWSRAKVINEDIEDEIPETVLSERMRIVVDFKCGSITDRVNVGPGELKIRLPVKDKTSLSIYRLPQQDMTIALSESQISKQTPGDMFQALQLTNRSASVRTFTFTSQRDLHDFQHALTGYKVLFDGVVATFAISRRRMVVPIYKKWEAGATRVQIVQSEDNIMQVLVFFEDFHHGQSMSFQLKATDVYESIKRGDKVGVKIDDAKFPLSPPPENREAPPDDMAFVCLDMPEIPGEHDDITILFEGEEARDDFIRCLPASVKGSKVSRTSK